MPVMFSFCSDRVKGAFACLCGLSRRAQAQHMQNGGSGNDVGCDLVFDEGDTIAQLQFALLQPLQPQQIWGGRMMQRIDRRVQIAVLLLQPGELGMQLALIFVGHDAR